MKQFKYVPKEDTEMVQAALDALLQGEEVGGLLEESLLEEMCTARHDDEYAKLEAQQRFNSAPDIDAWAARATQVWKSSLLSNQEKKEQAMLEELERRYDEDPSFLLDWDAEMQQGAYEDYADMCRDDAMLAELD